VSASVLRIALPNKGQLALPAQQMLREAGYLQSHHPRDLIAVDPVHDIEFYFLRPRDIATYVGAGTIALGITGRDLLRDVQAPAEEMMSLGFGASTFRLAVPAAVAIGDALGWLNGRRIATSYPGLLGEWLASSGVTADVVRLDGAVENAVGLGVADAVADVVDTGTTMRQAGLVPVGEPLLISEAVLIGRAGASASPEVTRFLRRLSSVLVARAYVMVDYDIRADLVERAVSVTPGIESPTVSPLHDPEWVAVRALIARRGMHETMDALYELGARGVLVTDIHACRL